LPSGDKFVLIFVAPGLRAIRDSPTDRLWLAPPPSADRVPRNEALEYPKTANATKQDGFVNRWAGGALRSIGGAAKVALRERRMTP